MSSLDLERIDRIRDYLRNLLLKREMNDLETAMALEDLATEIRVKCAAQWKEQNPG